MKSTRSGNQIGCEAAKGWIASLLANDLVRGGKTDEMSETLNDYDIAVMHKPAYERSQLKISASL
jgi:hypothetical protein